MILASDLVLEKYSVGVILDKNNAEATGYHEILLVLR